MEQKLTLKEVPVIDYRFTGTKRGKPVSGTIRTNENEAEALAALKKARVTNVSLEPIGQHSATLLK